MNCCPFSRFLRLIIFSLISIFGLTSISLFLCNPSDVQAESWNLYTVDPTSPNTRANILSPSFQLVADDSIILTYVYQPYNSGTESWDPGALKAAVTFDGGKTWTINTVDDTVNVGIGTSTTYEANELHVAVCYRDETNLDLEFAANTNPAIAPPWTLSTIDSAGDVGLYCSIATPSPTEYYVTYYDNTNKDLKFAVSSDGGATWTPSTIDSDGDVGKYSSLAWDTASSVEILIVSYFDDTNNDLKFAKSYDGGTTWIASTVDSTGDVGMYSSITADRAGTGSFLISYIRRDTNELKFAKSLDEGDTWLDSVVDSEQDVNYQTSIGTDPDGEYYIAYHWSGTYQDLRYARSSDQGAHWTKRTIDVVNNAGQYSFMEQQVQGSLMSRNGEIAYTTTNGTYSFLKFAISYGTGDINGDGSVSVSDYALFIRDYLTYIEDDSLDIRSDFNGDGRISVSDYALFIQAYLDYIHST
jgi:hypothetical protein